MTEPQHTSIKRSFVDIVGYNSNYKTASIVRSPHNLRYLKSYGWAPAYEYKEDWYTTSWSVLSNLSDQQPTPSHLANLLWNSSLLSSRNFYSKPFPLQYAYSISFLDGSLGPSTVLGLTDSYFRRIEGTGEAHRECWKLRELLSWLHGRS